jgi:hypothetical protein
MNLKSAYSLLNSANKNAQAAGSLVLSKIIVNSSDELLEQVIEKVMDKIATELKNGQFKATTALIETLIQIMFHIEGQFEPFAVRFVPILIELVQSND